TVEPSALPRRSARDDDRASAPFERASDVEIGDAVEADFDEVRPVSRIPRPADVGHRLSGHGYAQLRISHFQTGASPRPRWAALRPSKTRKPPQRLAEEAFVNP